MELKFIDIKTFKNEIYKYYKQLFPSDERKPFKLLKKSYKLNRCKFLEIFSNNVLIGFMIINIVDGISFIQLDYFAIFPEYQNKGYGTNSLKLLKEFFCDYIGLLGEVETIGYGSTVKDNENRIRRKKFYEKLGFIFLNYEFTLFNVKYTPCVFYFKKEKLEEEQIVKEMFELYNNLLGEKKVIKNCSYKNTK